MTQLDYVVDHRTGIAIVQPGAGLRAPYMTGTGLVTYRCHSCGELIPKHWEAFFVDPEPATAWASYIIPAQLTPTLTTHHDWHMAGED